MVKQTNIEEENLHRDPAYQAIVKNKLSVNRVPNVKSLNQYIELPLPQVEVDDADNTMLCEDSVRIRRLIENAERGGAAAYAGAHDVEVQPILEPPLEEESSAAKEREKDIKVVLEFYKQYLDERTENHLGYPYNLDFNYGALAELQQYSINNLGDPFVASNYGVHSRPFEVGVLDWFAHLWQIKAGDYWGYVTNCGTEGNLHGILVGREVHPDGILYASRESHYSVFKAARMYRMEHRKIATHKSGEIDCAHLLKELSANKDKPAIINVNIGTTVKGAVDDLDAVIATLKEAGFPESRFYIHCDGALFGLMIPFVKKAPLVTFQKPIGSVSVSGHKFIGCPTPCGVVITRAAHIAKFSSDVEYLASKDATIMGSRNGHASLYMWYTLSCKGYRGFSKEVKNCTRTARYFLERLRSVGIGSMLNRLSSTVVFERPEEEAFVHKWQLACEGPIAHAVVMPNISEEKLDRFLEDLLKSRERMGTNKKPTVCLEAVLGSENCACPSCHFAAK